VDITPGFLSSLAGWGPTLTTPRRARAAWGRLLARVLVLDDGQGERVALIAADLHAGTRYLTELLAARTADLGLHAGRIFLAGTHNHSGPGNFYANTFYDTFAQTEPLLEEQGLDQVMVDYLVERLALGVRESCARLRPARVGHGVARLWGYSHNRSFGALRENFPPGLDDAALRQRLAMLGFPDGTPPSVPSELPVDQLGVDPRVQVLWAEEAQAPHRPIGAFGTFGIHASLLSMEHAMFSPDLFGVATHHAELLLRGAPGEPGPVVGLAAGAIGDSDAARPGMTLEALKQARKDQTRNMSLVEEIGRRVGLQLAEACTNARAHVRPSLRITALFDEPRIRAATLKDGRRMPSAALVGAPTLRGSELGGGMACFKEGMRKKVPDDDPQWPKEPPLALERLIRETLKYQPLTLPLRLLKVGDLWLMGCPGEPTSWLAHGLAQAMRARGAREVMVTGVCGDYAGYLTTEREYTAQHYEGSSTLWGRNTEHWLLERFDALAMSGASALPSGVARFTVRKGRHRALTAPQPPTSEPTPLWPRPPEFAAPRLTNGRLVLAGRWFAWAPQERSELGWGAWIRLEDADTGEVLHSASRPLDDQHHTFLLEFDAKPAVIEWRWLVVLDDWQHLRDRRIRFRTQGPRGVSVRPPPGGQWPEERLSLGAPA
jgi:neutral ceramidase